MYWGVSKLTLELKLSKVFIFKKIQKVLEYKTRFCRDSWGLCRYYFICCVCNHLRITFMSQCWCGCFLQLAPMMAHGTCRLLELLIKGQPKDLSLITGAAEDWGKVIKAATTPAVPWQEIDQTNLCSCSCKINVQFKILLLTRQVSPEWQCPTFLASDFYFLFFLSHIISPTALTYQACPGICHLPDALCCLCLPLSCPRHSFLWSTHHDHFVVGPRALMQSLWPLYWVGPHPSERGELIKPGHRHSVATRGWAIAILKMHDAKNSLVVS